MLRTRIQTTVAACASSLPRVEHLVASQHAGGACKRLEDPAVPAASGTGHFCCFFHCQLPAAPPQRHASMSSKHTGTVGGDKTPETIQEADDVMNALYDIANILDTGLDRETLSILVGLCETGVNPEALAAVVKELQKESSQVATDHSN